MMTMETILIFLIFSGAIFYLGRMILKQFFGQSNAGCAKGCGTCQTNIPVENFRSPLES